MKPPPALPGSYALVLALEAAVELRVGRLGAFAFPAGRYVYCGSAFGPGGLAARMGRHAAGTGAPHWHIDVLRRAAMLEDWVWVVDERWECRWAQALRAAGGVVVAPGFGSSDCRSGCASHLLYFAGDRIFLPI